MFQLLFIGLTFVSTLIPILIALNIILRHSEILFQILLIIDSVANCVTSAVQVKLGVFMCSECPVSNLMIAAFDAIKSIDSGSSPWLLNQLDR